jgi:quercetin dioxygenase-like cupin family protein
MACAIESRPSFLDKLKVLTDKLNKFPAATYGEGEGGGYAEYSIGDGECFSWVVHRSGNDLSVHRWFITKGSVLKDHIHTEREWIIVYQGEMLMEVDGVETLLKKGDSVTMQPGQKHSSTYPQDCKFITVTIPTSKDFYHGN